MKIIIETRTEANIPEMINFLDYVRTQMQNMPGHINVNFALVVE